MESLLYENAFNRCCCYVQFHGCSMGVNKQFTQETCRIPFENDRIAN